MADVRWTPEQVAAILAGGDTLLSANAGSGKTTTVIGKVLWLLGLDVGVAEATGKPLPSCPDPCGLHEIAAITFTEKAAHDLKEKLRKEIGRSARAEELRWEIDRASIGTIHSFCASLLREHALRLGIDPTFGILDEREARAAQDDLIRDVVLEALEAEDEAVAQLFQDKRLRGWQHTNGLIDLVRAAMADLRWHRDHYDGWCRADGGGLDMELLRRLSPDGADAADGLVLTHCDALYRLAHTARDRWSRHLNDENVRDYDALILDTRELLTAGDDTAAAALASIRRRYRVLIIDEFQDTDRAQADIAFAIGRGVPRPQLYFVGDPKQSIYRFRGADITVWNDVARDLGGDGEILSLTRNFRSQPELIGYLNAVGEAAIEEAGEGLEAELPGSRVRYSPLEPGLPGRGTAGVEFLAADGKPADARRTAEGEQVARRIRELVANGEPVVDPDTGETRPCRYRDIAILYRSGTGLENYTRVLAHHGVPVFHPAQGGLGERQEIADVVNALRLVDNPADDLAAFAFLRSPFVGLRDEVLARIAMDRGRRSLLYHARAFVDREDANLDHRWWPAPEDPRVAEIERKALADGLALLDDLTALAARLPLDELVAELLDRSGYRLHLLLMGENREALGNLQTLLRLAEQHRKQPLGTFLDIWAAWDEQDAGLPQAPLYSADDDVVTLSTIHRAKGLEWPVVFLIDTAGTFRDQSSGDYWSDRERGPMLAPKKSDRGPRATALAHRNALEERAEEARLLYVATTRARDRLVVTGPAPTGDSHMAWLLAGAECDAVSDRTAAAPLEPVAADVGVSLDWLDRLRPAGPSPLADSLPEPPLRWLTSATEVMMREDSPEEWALRYRHGVEPAWAFAPERKAGEGDALPARVRGTIIHGALERYPPGPLEQARRDLELARILDEVIGELDAPELEPYLARGQRYREALEREVARVVSSDSWAWYTEGAHHRELPFLHLTQPRAWTIGAFDLYRPGDPARIIDFKTHEIDATKVEAAAATYRRQVELYRAAAEMAGAAEVRLFFTGPGVEVGEDVTLRGGGK